MHKVQAEVLVSADGIGLEVTGSLDVSLFSETYVSNLDVSMSI